MASQRFGFLSLSAILVSSAIGFAAVAVGAPIEIMSYNVQNLFDAEHDVENGEDKEDLTFTPIGTPGKAEYCDGLSNRRYAEECEVDWTDSRVKEKIKQLVKVIKADRKSLPDILGLIEVENLAVVTELADALGYPKDNVYVTTSPDKRGIDVAVIYKNKTKDLAFVGAEEFEVEGSSSIRVGDTRNILQAEFKVYGKHSLFVYVAHWPSQSAPASVRLQVAKETHEKIDTVLKKSTKNHVVLMGDFNVIPSDHPNPLNDITTSEDNKNRLYDIHDSFWRSPFVPQAEKYALPLGTYFYKPQMTWNLLDRIFVTKNLEPGYKPDCQEGLFADATTYHIHHPKIASVDYEYKKADWNGSFLVGNKVVRIPREYLVVKNGARNVGFSDHYGVSVKLDQTANKPEASECEGYKKYYKD